MDARGNLLNLDVGSLQKLSFKTTKFLEKGRFQSYIMCGEVVEWSMRQSLKEYIPAVVRSWWAIIGLLVEALGIGSGVSGNTILLPYWAWVIIGIIALIWAQFLAYHKVREQRDEARNEVASAISDLESNIINLGGQSTNMAMLFWKMRDYFLEGIQPGTTPGNIYKVVEGADKDDCNKAWGNLKKRLRLLQLICDAQRPHPFKSTGYIVMITTSLGASVLNELDKKWKDSRWGRSVSEEVSNKEGAQG
jgi:hypothetical protein